ncbi:MAG: DUF2490 domain-containing protein [Sphingobacteriales bacterium]|nr:MAG: DUF2490 domain-containing protein [Sphingobacteriales bacterium]
MTRITIIFCLVIAVIAGNAKRLAAQPVRIYDKNTNAWFMYFGDHQLTKKWGLHTELQLRRHDVISDPQQLLLRTGINYNLSPRAMATLGYAFVETYPYGDYPAATAFPEHRIYQQLLLKDQYGIAALQHRFRLEQRWITFANQPSAIYLNRARYMFRTNIALAGKTIDKGELYIGLYDEIFINFGKNVAKNVYDQNRLYLALGYKASAAMALEAGYMNQNVAQRNGTIFEDNHTLQFSIIYNADFRKKDNN